MDRLLVALASDLEGFMALGMFCAGILLWCFWVLKMPERRRVRTFALFLVLLGGELLLIGSLAATVLQAMHGTACVMYWRLLTTICNSHETSPAWFWMSVLVLSVGGVVFMLMLLVLLVRLVRRGSIEPVARPEASRYERPVGKAAASGDPWRIVLVSTIVIVVALVAWISGGLRHRGHARDHRGDARRQVAQALASTVPVQHAVAGYLRRHHALPADNAAAGLPAPGDLHIPRVHAVRVRKGVILVTFEASRVAEPVRGHTLMLIPVRHRLALAWRCTSLDIDDRDLPGQCGGRY